MTRLLFLATSILTGLSPLLFVTALLLLAAWRDRRAAARTARQVRLTDALAEEIGAIVAPIAKRRFRKWQIVMRVPFGRPALVARVLGVVHRTLEGLAPIATRSCSSRKSLCSSERSTGVRLDTAREPREEARARRRGGRRT